MTILFFDTEATGVKSWREPGFIPRLVQLGAILQDTESGRVLAEVNLMVDPQGVEIPAGASAVHGISTELAKRHGTTMTKIDDLFDFLVQHANLVVAHNIAYDLDVVKDNLPASDLEVDAVPKLCTMEASRMVVKAPLTEKQVAYFRSKGQKPDYPFKSRNLTETFKYFFGVPFEGAHDAMADIRACRDIFFELVKRGALVIDGREVKAAA